MSFSKKSLILLALLAISILLFVFNRINRSRPDVETKKTSTQTPSFSKQSRRPQPHSLPELPDLTNREAIHDPVETRITRYTNGTVDLKAATQASRKLYQSTQPSDDLELLANIFIQYRFIYQTNPVGSENAEITEQLLGFNDKQVIFLDPQFANINPSHELLDRWGHPYFFHPVSSTQMGLRSRGPDGLLWTEDDLILEE